MNDDLIRIETDSDGIAVLTLDMPGRSANVWNESSITAFSAALTRVIDEPAIRGAVVTSGKKTFLAGADLEAVKRMTSGEYGAAELMNASGALQKLLRRMETCGKPWVAAINGAAMGGGFEFCLACHHRVIVDDPRVKVGQPEIKLGLLPGAGGTQRIPRLIGIEGALPMLLQGIDVPAPKALKMGLVHQAVPRDKLLDTAKAWIREHGHSTQPWDRKGFKVPGGPPNEGRAAQTMMVASAMYQAKTHGNYPAGNAILSCIHDGVSQGIDVGLELEVRYFVSLLLGPTAPAMVRTLFLNLQEANKLAGRPTDVPKVELRNIAVIGAGLMGAGVANTAAKAGLNVILIDRDLAAAEKGKQHAARLMDKKIKRGKATEAQKAERLNRIEATDEYSKLSDCQLVVEAVFENREIKAQVTQFAEEVLPSSAIFGSNTSTLPITGLAKASSRPHNFIGLHFFSPVEKMPLVEIITGEKTSDTALAHALDFVQRIGKTPIVVKDSRGFYTSRVFSTYVIEGIAMLREGIEPALIERAGILSGMPMPPLGLADEVGIELMYHVGQQTKADLGDAYEENESAPVLALMVPELGRTGKKVGKGFYDYSERGQKQLWTGLAEHFAPNTEQPPTSELIDRFLYVQAVETARVMAEELMDQPADADIGAILGWGFAPYTGGPLSFIDNVGTSNFVARADELADTYGKRFCVPDALRQMSKSDEKYYGEFD